MMGSGIGSGSALRRQGSVSPLDSWRQTGQRVTHGGYTYYLRIGGEGPPVLALHGYPTSSYDWHRVWNRLCSSHQVFAPDLLGLGLSDKPIAHRYSIQDHADFQEAVLVKFGLSDVRIVAHDLGVSVALEMLARRLENPVLPTIRSVVLINGCLFGDACRPSRLHSLLSSVAREASVPPASRAAFVATLGELFAPGAGPSAAELSVWWRLLSSREGLRVCAQVGRFVEEEIELRGRLQASLASHQVPVRFVTSALDPSSTAATARRSLELAPRADQVELPGVGHWPHLEAPGLVAAFILEFFRRSH